MRRQQGRPQEAVALLAPIYAWFTEGFDTADLKEAETLLDKLTEPAIGVSPMRMAGFSRSDPPAGEVVKVGFGSTPAVQSRSRERRVSAANPAFRAASANRRVGWRLPLALAPRNDQRAPGNRHSGRLASA